MKKLFVILLSLVVSLSVLSPSFAISESEPFVDHLTDETIKKSSDEPNFSSSVPSSSNVWNLSSGTYYMSFDFMLRVYSNYCLQTDTGEIKVTTNFTDSSYNKSLPVEVSLHKKTIFGSSPIGTKTVPRNGSGSVTFTGLNSTDKYFLEFSKANDSVTITGNGQANE